ncbi:MAG: DUF1015 domain-containing protein [Clostridia bacterium]|nr:DUF1015 domain-containing protein [Clostridia bacterium]MBQ7048118.1 DUF1015 domain-containing protein [Clostridia bacterium]
MADIRPIKALRYTKTAGPISANVCPPYDIISDEERAELIAGSPYNLVRLEKPEGENRYNDASDLLESWLSKDILGRDKEAGIYVYGEDFEVDGERFSLKGIICLCRLYPFSEGIVLPHENTLSGAKADRFELMKTTYCNFSSIYGLYVDEERIIADEVKKASSLAPEQCFTDNEGVTHTLWRIADEEVIKLICDTMAPKQVFIADGHHRYETAVKFRDYLAERGECAANRDYVLMTLVDMDNEGLVILPTHRLIRDMEIDKAKLLSDLSADFEIEEYPNVKLAPSVLSRYTDRKAYGLYMGGEGFTLLLYKGQLPQVDDGGLSALDVSVLHDRILEEKLGIDKENMARQLNLRYTRHISEAVESVKSGESAAAFILNPTKIGEIKSVSLSGGKMPQKSTYFYPKLKTGLVMNTIKEERY